MKKLIDFIIILSSAVIGFLYFRQKLKEHNLEQKKNVFLSDFTKKRIHHTQTPVFKKHMIRPKMNSFSEFITKYPIQIMGILVITIALSFTNLKNYGFLFKASLINVQAPAFNGTTFPVKKTPIWTALTDKERTYSYNQIPKSKMRNILPYDISKMQKGTEWKPNNAYERDTYITYSVPYMGNYKLDGTEHSGSHLGVDIKIPIGTPIYSIANGIVYDVQHKKTGFGNVIAIAHTNVPDPEHNGRKTNIISVYAHLSQTLVKTGQTIKKGQLIAKSGSSGASTAPHLHFQIDRDNAPFSPYWHFSWNEAKSAGYNSFFTAVENGFHKSQALKYTINPVEFAYDYQNFSIDEQRLVASEGQSTNTRVVKRDKKINKKPVFDYIPTKPSKIQTVQTPPDLTQNTNNKIIKASGINNSGIIVADDLKTSAPKTTEPISNPTQVILAEKAPIIRQTTTHKRGQLRLQIKTDRSYVPGIDEKVQITINEANLVASNGIELSSTLKNRAIVYPSRLEAKDFKNGVADVIVRTESPYPFKIVAKGDFGKIKSESLRPEIFTDVPGNHIYAKAITYLRDTGIVSGYKDGSFKPNNTLNRAEAVKLILEANDIRLENAENKFTDIKTSDWFAKYVNTAAKKGIIKGYNDGSFKPGNTITLAEFLKIAVETAKFKTSTVSKNPYPDVIKNTWFAKYFQFAKQQKLLRVKKGGLVIPNNAIDRGEAANIIYLLSQIKRR